jgi:hypothetical protein
MPPASPSGALWANLITAVFEALDLAAEGHVADGYQVLLIGEQRALEGEAKIKPSEKARPHAPGKC